MVSVTTY
jgi:hypothetical protein